MTGGRRSSSFAFSAYRREMTKNLEALTEEFPDHALDEHAVPSYSHANPLGAWLFWQRLRHAIQYLEGQNLKRVLDFGCGAGVLFPYLLPRCERLFAFDIHDQASRATIKRLGLKGVQLLDPADGQAAAADVPAAGGPSVLAGAGSAEPGDWQAGVR